MKKYDISDAMVYLNEEMGMTLDELIGDVEAAMRKVDMRSSTWYTLLSVSDFLISIAACD